MGEAEDFKGLRDPPQAPPGGFSFLSRARLFAARGLPAPQNQNAPRQHDDRRDDCDQLNPPSPSRGVPAFIGHADDFLEKWPIRNSALYHDDPKHTELFHDRSSIRYRNSLTTFTLALQHRPDGKSPSHLAGRGKLAERLDFRIRPFRSAPAGPNTSLSL
jgi:hypothetical protein